MPWWLSKLGATLAWPFAVVGRKIGVVHLARSFTAAGRKIKASWHTIMLAGILISILFFCRGPRYEYKLRRRCDADFRAAKQLYHEGKYASAALRFGRHILFFPNSPHMVEAYRMAALSQVRHLRAKGDAHEIDYELPLKHITFAEKLGIDPERLDTVLLEVAHGLFEIRSYRRALEMFRAALERKKERVLLKLNIAYCLARLSKEEETLRRRALKAVAPWLAKILPSTEEEALKEVDEFIEIMRKSGSREGEIRGVETRAAILQEFGRFGEAGDTLARLASSGYLHGKPACQAFEAAGLAYLRQWAALPPEADRDPLLHKAWNNFVAMSNAAADLGVTAQREIDERVSFHTAVVARLGRFGIDPVQKFTSLAESNDVSLYIRYAAALHLGDLYITGRGREIEGLRWLEKAFNMANPSIIADTSLVDGPKMIEHLYRVAENLPSAEAFEAIIRVASSAAHFMKDDLTFHRTIAQVSERLASLYRADAANSEKAGDAEAAARLRRKANDLLVSAAMAYKQMLALAIPEEERDEILYRMGCAFFESGHFSRAVSPLVECGIDRAHIFNPFAAPALILLGKVYTAQGAYESARDAFEKCMAIAERTDYSRQARYERARTFEIEGNYTSAIQAYEEIFEFGPQDGMSPEHPVWLDSLLALGKLHLELGQKENRNKWAEATAPPHTGPTIGTKHLARATELCEEAFERSHALGIERRFDSAYLLSLCYIAQREWEKAWNMLAVTCSLADKLEAPDAAARPTYAPSKHRIFLLAADCTYMLGNYLRALDEYEEAERRAEGGPDQVLAIIGRARCLIELQRTHEARQALERARFCVERMEETQFASPDFGKDHLRRMIDDLQKKVG